MTGAPAGAACPTCGEPTTPGDSFCEACGGVLSGGEVRLNPADPEKSVVVEIASVARDPEQGADQLGDCPSCSAQNCVGGDGYCQECGLLVVRERDHLEYTEGIAGGATDRGKQHHRNEDAMWLGTHASGAVLSVVSDGVSSSFDPDVASDTAVRTAAMALAAGPIGPETCVAAAVAAGAAVAALVDGADPGRTASNPACTIVTSSWNGTSLDYAWVGDSRIYFVPLSGPAQQLSVDDSWATMQISAGVTPAVAYADSRAHSITAWLGADAGPVTPGRGSFRPVEGGWAISCSDGLWNYLEDPAAFASRVQQAVGDAGADPTTVGRLLCAFACAQGGADNVTVSAWPIAPATSSTTASEESTS